MLDSSKIDWSQMRQLITDQFDLEELRTLCFDLNIDYDSLRGEGKQSKVRELVALVKRNGRTKELLDILTQLRPNTQWSEIKLRNAAFSAVKLRQRQFKLIIGMAIISFITLFWLRSIYIEISGSHITRVSPESVSSFTLVEAEQTVPIQVSRQPLIVPTVQQASLPTSEVINDQCLLIANTESINAQVISPDNVEQIHSIARLGKGIVHDLAWHPDGKVLAVATSIGIYLHDADTLEELKFISSGGVPVWSVAFSPDGIKLASGNSYSDVQIYDSNTGQLLTTLEATSGINRGANSIAFSPDGSFLAASGFYATVWDTNTWKKIESLSGETNNSVLSVDFNPDGSKLLVASTNGNISIWNTDNFGTTHDPEVNVNVFGSPTIVDFNSDGLTFASAGTYGEPAMRSVETGRLLSSLNGHTEEVLSLDFSSDGLLLASSGADKTIKLWEVGTGRLLNSIEEFTNSVTDIAFSPSENLLVSASEDGAIWVWDIKDINSLQLINMAEGYTAEVTSIAFHPSGDVVAAGSRDSTVSLWDINSNQLLYKLVGHTSPVLSVAFSPDGCLLALGGEDNTIRLWDVRTGEFIRQFEGHTYYVTRVVFSPDGNTLASGSEDGTAKLWNVEDAELLYTFKGHANQYSVTEYLSLEFSLDGSKLISAGSNSKVKVWDIFSGQPIHNLELGEENHKVLSLAISPTFSLVAIASLENIQIWNPDTAQFLRKLERDGLYAGSIVFSPDGGLLASASRSANWTMHQMVIDFWNPHTDEILNQFYYSIEGHSDDITSIDFSPNGQHMASGSLDGTVQIWGINP